MVKDSSPPDEVRGMPSNLGYKMPTVTRNLIEWVCWFQFDNWLLCAAINDIIAHFYILKKHTEHSLTSKGNEWCRIQNRYTHYKICHAS